MKTNTRRIAPAALLVGVFLASLAPAAASDVLQAEIPFDFVVGNRTLPGGSYEVSLHPSGLLRLQGVDNGGAAVSFTVGLGGSSALDSGQLIFLASGDLRLLAELWEPGRGNGRALLPNFKVRTYDRYARIAIALQPKTSDSSG